MTAIYKRAGNKIPIYSTQKQGSVAQGFVTPAQDKVPQVQCVPPAKVIPIVFIPGIMGSNLRMTVDRQGDLGQSNNISWRPDNSLVTIQQYDGSPAERQMRLDPRKTEVDTYTVGENVTGDPKESSDERNANVGYPYGYGGWKRLDGPLLQSDPPGAKNRRTEDQKARERRWGEVFFGSYQFVLTMCENNLNSAFSNGTLDAYLAKYIDGIDPVRWQAHPTPKLQKVDRDFIYGCVKGCWFPVHAMGYNWLKSNRESGKIVADRILKLIQGYQDQGFKCQKVILVTHSMGGLVARAAIHPEIGNINDKVLGIVHGVMPAVGAGAAYRRMRCGVENSWFDPSANIAAGVLGSDGENVTAVLAAAQGALELLPSRLYGTHWLQLKIKGKIINSWPEKCPYEEIYKAKGKWYGLFKEEWINPAGLKNSEISETFNLLGKARRFHEEISTTYHENSYAHYGADPEQRSWYKVVWEAAKQATVHDSDSLKIVGDNGKGKLELVDEETMKLAKEGASMFAVTMQDAVDPGDQTVPLYSSDAQLRSGKFKGTFRQVGYEHQASYSQKSVVDSTLYSLFKIISTMVWNE